MGRLLLKALWATFRPSASCCRCHTTGPQNKGGGGRGGGRAHVAGAAAGRAHSASGRKDALPVIGFLRSASLADAKHLITAFQQGLRRNRTYRRPERTY